MLQTNILFLDESNNDRSIMAEAYFNRGLNNAVRSFSAGFKPEDKLDKFIFDLLREKGIAPEDYCPKPIDVFLQAYSPRIDLIVVFEPLQGQFKLPLFPYKPPVATLKVFGSRERNVGLSHKRRSVRETYADLRLAIDRAMATGLLPGSMAA